MSIFGIEMFRSSFLASRSLLSIENLHSVVGHRHCLLSGIESRSQKRGQNAESRYPQKDLDTKKETLAISIPAKRLGCMPKGSYGNTAF